MVESLVGKSVGNNVLVRKLEEGGMGVTYEVWRNTYSELKEQMLRGDRRDLAKKWCKIDHDNPLTDEDKVKIGQHMEKYVDGMTQDLLNAQSTEERLKCYGDGGSLVEHISPERLLHGSLERAVRHVLKMMKEDEAKARSGTDPNFKKRFELEIEIARKLRHPNIAALIESGRVGETRFFVTEHIDHTPLDSGNWSVEQAATIIHNANKGLIHAHENHILHRDLKPDNILVPEDLEAKLIDFGMARDISDKDAVRRLTQTGITAGTPAYLPPEVVREEEREKKSDLYSLAATFYFVLTGEPPVTATDSGKVLNQLAKKDDWLWARDLNPDVSEELEDLVMEALNKVPSMRPTTYEFNERLLDLIEKGKLQYKQRSEDEENERKVRITELKREVSKLRFGKKRHLVRAEKFEELAELYDRNPFEVNDRINAFEDALTNYEKLKELPNQSIVDEEELEKRIEHLKRKVIDEKKKGDDRSMAGQSIETRRMRMMERLRLETNKMYDNIRKLEDSVSGGPDDLGEDEEMDLFREIQMLQTIVEKDPEEHGPKLRERKKLQADLQQKKSNQIELDKLKEKLATNEERMIRRFGIKKEAIEYQREVKREERIVKSHKKTGMVVGGLAATVVALALGGNYFWQRSEMKKAMGVDISQAAAAVVDHKYDLARKEFEEADDLLEQLGLSEKHRLVKRLKDAKENLLKTENSDLATQHLNEAKAALGQEQYARSHEEQSEALSFAEKLSPFGEFDDLRREISGFERLIDETKNTNNSRSTISVAEQKLGEKLYDEARVLGEEAKGLANQITNAKTRTLILEQITGLMTRTDNSENQDVFSVHYGAAQTALRGNSYVVARKESKTAREITQRLPKDLAAPLIEQVDALDTRIDNTENRGGASQHFGKAQSSLEKNLYDSARAELKEALSFAGKLTENDPLRQKISEFGVEIDNDENYDRAEAAYKPVAGHKGGREWVEASEALGTVKKHLELIKKFHSEEFGKKVESLRSRVETDEEQIAKYQTDINIFKSLKQELEAIASSYLSLQKELKKDKFFLDSIVEGLEKRLESTSTKLGVVSSEAVGDELDKEKAKVETIQGALPALLTEREAQLFDYFERQATTLNDFLTKATDYTQEDVPSKLASAQGSLETALALYKTHLKSSEGSKTNKGRKTRLIRERLDMDITSLRSLGNRRKRYDGLCKQAQEGSVEEQVRANTDLLKLYLGMGRVAKAESCLDALPDKTGLEPYLNIIYLEGEVNDKSKYVENGNGEMQPPRELVEKLIGAYQDLGYDNQAKAITKRFKIGEGNFKIDKEK